jgi:anti-sigma regulatory factor (Ser/Thr protein kinase)
MPSEGEVCIVLDPRAEAMTRLSAWLDTQEEALELPPKVAFALRLCLEEAVLNIVNHGGADAPVIVRLHPAETELTAEIVDRGPPFDPRIAPEPAKPANLREAAIGGLGIHLIRNFAARIEYDTAADGNRLTLHFAP